MKPLLFCLFFCPFCVVYAQNSLHHRLWGRLDYLEQINNKHQIHLIYQDIHQDWEQNMRIWEHESTRTLWILWHYKIQENVTISIAPINYFHLYPLLVQPSDFQKNSLHEWRSSIRISFSQKIKAWTYISRYGIEYRNIEKSDKSGFQANWRFRYFTRLHRNIKLGSKDAQLIFFDEFFMQFGQGFKQKFDIFDQNRIYLGVNYPISKYVRFELAYLHILQQRGTSPNFAIQHHLYLNLIFQNLFQK